MGLAKPVAEQGMLAARSSLVGGKRACMKVAHGGLVREVLYGLGWQEPGPSWGVVRLMCSQRL